MRSENAHKAKRLDGLSQAHYENQGEEKSADTGSEPSEEAVLIGIYQPCSLSRYFVTRAAVAVRLDDPRLRPNSNPYRPNGSARC